MKIDSVVRTKSCVPFGFTRNDPKVLFLWTILPFDCNKSVEFKLSLRWHEIWAQANKIDSGKMLLPRTKSMTTMEIKLLENTWYDTP